MSVREKLEEIRRMVRTGYPDMVDEPGTVPHDIDRSAAEALAGLDEKQPPPGDDAVRKKTAQ